ncbi:hypothetical protein JXA32_13315 [Candidatus Sumerlaeota bacterium]|nr:hypothetical protein [Candidatus Sumerlaeota bacterium]
MRRLTLLLGACALLTSCALFSKGTGSDASDPDKAVIGVWRGLGLGASIVIEIKKNHTYHEKGERDSSRWSYEQDEYRFYTDEGTRDEAYWRGSINEEGCLVWKMPGIMFGPVFRREVPVKPAAVPKDFKKPEGEWKFAYLKKGAFPIGPPFDIIEFIKKDKLRIHFITMGKQFEIKSNITHCEINIPLTDESARSMGQSLAMSLAYRLEDDGDTLILSNMSGPSAYQIEWAFLRSSDMPVSDLCGSWIGRRDDGSSMRFAIKEDGVIERIDVDPAIVRANIGDKGVPDQYYRIWDSPFGRAITLCAHDREMQMIHVTSCKYEKKDGVVVLTPIRLEQGEKMTLIKNEQYAWKALEPAETP